MEFEKMRRYQTADEILDRSFRRAAKKMKEKTNKERATKSSSGPLVQRFMIALLYHTGISRI